jgi:hypothetical protein
MTNAREQLVDALAEAFAVERCDVVSALAAIDARRQQNEAARLFLIEHAIEPIYRMWLAQAQAAGAIPPTPPAKDASYGWPYG